jgi:hypothetical protein
MERFSTDSARTAVSPFYLLYINTVTIEIEFVSCSCFTFIKPHCKRGMLETQILRLLFIAANREAPPVPSQHSTETCVALCNECNAPSIVSSKRLVHVPRPPLPCEFLQR